MADSTSPQRRSSVGVRLFLEVVLLLLIAAGIYFEYARETKPRHLKLALITWTQDPFWQPLLRGAQEYADHNNIDLTIIKSEPTVDAQTKHIRDALNSGVDGIAISPNDAIAQRAILDEAASKVPIVTFDTDAPDSQRRRFVGIDNYAAGKICASELMDAMPNGGPVLISVGSVSMQHGSQRRQGVIDQLLGRGFDRNRPADPLNAVLKGPKFSIVYTATDGGVPAKAVDAIAAGLRAHPEVKGIIGLFSYSAPAALEAIKKVGRHSDEFQIVGFDASSETQAALEAGTIHSSILQDSYHCGYETIEVLANEARGIPRGPAELTPVVYVGINVLTKNNLPLLQSSGELPAAAAASTEPAAP
ncbi:MAG TPA: substrate-binding domain-containing protein [Tepidisphaeraceae bacterium]